MTDATELLDRIKKDLPNKGTWYWAETNGTKARLLVVITKLLKAGVEDDLIIEVVVDMMYTGYVEHERQVKAKTGLSVHEFMEKKLEDEKPSPKSEAPKTQEDQEHHEVA